MMESVNGETREDCSAEALSSEKDFSGIRRGDFSCIQRQEDFYVTALYDEIYKIEGDRERKITIAKITNKAKELGKAELVSQFKTLCKETEKEIKEKKEEEKRLAMNGGIKNSFANMVVGMTNYSNLPEGYKNMHCGEEWIADDDGVCRVDRRGNVFHASNTPILITGMFKSTESGSQKLCLLYKSEGKWMNRVIERKVLGNVRLTAALSEFGVGVTINTAPHLIDFLNSMLIESCDRRDELRSVPSTSKLGWDENLEKFIPYDNDVYFDMQDRFPGLVHALEPHGDPEEWMNVYKSLRASGQTFFKFATAAVLSSPLLALEKCDEGFICNIFGTSGGGKSVCNKIAATIWGNYQSSGNFVYSAKNTSARVEITMATLNNLPFIVEDYNNLSEKEKAEFQGLVMQMANGRGKGRASRNMSASYIYRWLSTVLINSEQLITARFTTEGSINRVLVCKSPDKFPWIMEDGVSAAKRLMKFFAKNYGHAGRMFVEALRELGEEGIAEITARKTAEITKTVRVHKKSERQVEPLVILLTADEIAEKYIFKDGVTISIEEAMTFIVDNETLSQYERFYKQLTGIVLQNLSNFERDGSIEDIHGKYWGKYIDDETGRWVCIEPTVLNELENKYDVDHKLFISHLKKNNLLDAEKGRNQKRVKSAYTGVQELFYKIKLPGGSQADKAEKIVQYSGKDRGNNAVRTIGNGFIPAENIEVPF